ncbi:MAG: RHS repeat-associated core domain-containing protein [Chlorobi bacterium]|nr:RHS repeat-associated core domain-containing protein [Chlorobiota bacterium]
MKHSGTDVFASGASAPPVAVDTPGTKTAARPRLQIYCYHPDHLGTGMLITDLEGRPHQFFLNLPYGETFIEQKHAGYDNPYKFNGKELDEETGLYYYGARYYAPKISLWLSVDPLAEKFNNSSPYVYTLSNPVMLADPNGLDTLDLYRNKKGIWEIHNYQRVEGDDVIRLRGEGVQPNDYVFSEGEYGDRVIALNLEGNENYTLGVFLVSGASKEYDEGAYGFYVVPGGEASNKVGSNARLPDDIYTISGSPGRVWVQPGVIRGNKVGDVSLRGVRFHYYGGRGGNEFGNPREWTDGCFVLFSSYTYKNGKLWVNVNDSKRTSMFFDLQLGATRILPKAGSKNRLGGVFGNGIQKHTLILKTANRYSW